MMSHHLRTRGRWPYLKRSERGIPDGESAAHCRGFWSVRRGGDSEVLNSEVLKGAPP